jgi:hypothetical protein
MVQKVVFRWKRVALSQAWSSMGMIMLTAVRSNVDVVSPAK